MKVFKICGCYVPASAISSLEPRWAGQGDEEWIIYINNGFEARINPNIYYAGVQGALIIADIKQYFGIKDD